MIEPRILRVFPSSTAMTPRDPLAFVGWPPMFLPEFDEIHVSVTFSWDLALAKQLRSAWSVYARGRPVRLGGPATAEPGGPFTPGRYLAEGVTVSSRGCPNRCRHCSVPEREGKKLRTLPVRAGWNLIDDNLLACPDDHVREVFAMLAGQPQPAQLTGGLEARLLKPWHVLALRALKPESMFFAFDGPEDWEPLVAAGRRLRAGGFVGKGESGKPHRALRCYVLVGFERDAPEAAVRRLVNTCRAGFIPMAMLYQDPRATRRRKAEGGWIPVMDRWVRPADIHEGFHKHWPEILAEDA